MDATNSVRSACIYPYRGSLFYWLTALLVNPKILKRKSHGILPWPPASSKDQLLGGVKIILSVEVPLLGHLCGESSITRTVYISASLIVSEMTADLGYRRALYREAL